MLTRGRIVLFNLINSINSLLIAFDNGVLLLNNGQYRPEFLLRDIEFMIRTLDSTGQVIVYDSGHWPVQVRS